MVRYLQEYRQELPIPITTPTAGTTLETHCLQCKAKRVMVDPYLSKFANGSPIWKGTDSEGHKVFKILGKDEKLEYADAIANNA